MRLLKFELDECELTGVVAGLHLHHVVFKSHGGDDVRPNIVCMVGWLHDRYHAGDPVVMERLAIHIKTVRVDTAAYIAKKTGALDAWYARHYS